MFQKAFEQSRVDLASANLESVWTAERLYWAQNKTFAGAIVDLETAGLLDPSFLLDLSKPNAPFQYAILAADDVSFQAAATRSNSTRWTGRLTINQQGVFTGVVTGSDGSVINPAAV